MSDRIDNVIGLKLAFHAGPIFDHPREVLSDANLTIQQKREILASWASDAAAVASNPRMRKLPGSHRLVAVDDILAALIALDPDPNKPPGGKSARLKSTSRLAMAA